MRRINRITIEKTNAQVLVAVLLALTVISILIIGMVSVVNRDVQQTVANREYQALYTAAENKVLQYVNDYGVTQTPDCPETPTGSGTYICSETDGNNTITIKVRDTNVVEDYTLVKDEGLVLDVRGYGNNTVCISYTNQAQVALELTLLYAGGDSVVTDVYDTNGIIDKDAGSRTMSISPCGTAEFGVNLNYANPVSLRITARMSSGTTDIDVFGVAAGFPNQMRVFEGTGESDTGVADIKAIAETKLPLYPQSLQLFNYVLLSKTNISKN